MPIEYRLKQHMNFDGKTYLFVRTNIYKYRSIGTTTEQCTIFDCQRKDAFVMSM
jgi:hypothetical protein